MSERRFMEGWDYAPWHKPKERYLGNGVYVRTERVSHYLAGLIYAGWRKLRPKEGNGDG